MSGVSDAEGLPSEPASASIRHLSEPQRDMLWFRLRGAEVPYSVSGESVLVPQRCADVLAEAMRWVEEDLAPMPSDHAPPRPFHRTDDVGNVVAPRWKRVLGWWIDSLFVSIAYGVAIELDVSSWVAFAVVGVYVVACTRWFAGTPGKLVVGIEVVDAAGEDRARIGWGRSIARWAVTVSVAVVAGLLGSNPVSEVLLFVSPIVFYAPILWDPRGQGLHDRLARTVVLERRPRS